MSREKVKVDPMMEECRKMPKDEGTISQRRTQYHPYSLTKGSK